MRKIARLPPEGPRIHTPTGSADGVRHSDGGGFFADWFPFTRGQKWIAVAAIALLLWEFANEHERGSLDPSRQALSDGCAIAALIAIAAVIPLKVVERTRGGVHRSRHGEPAAEVALRRARDRRRWNDAVVVLLVAAAALLTVAVEIGR